MGDLGGRGLKCSWGQEWAGNGTGYIRNGTLGPFWLTRKLLGRGVPEPRCWENPQKTLGLGSLQLGGSCAPGIGANHKAIAHLLWFLTFTPASLGRRSGPPSPTGSCGGIRRKLENNCMLKGLGRWMFSCKPPRASGLISNKVRTGEFCTISNSGFKIKSSPDVRFFCTWRIVWPTLGNAELRIRVCNCSSREQIGFSNYL